MSALSKSKLEPQMGGGMMLGAYLATHLSIMLENFEVAFSFIGILSQHDASQISTMMKSFNNISFAALQSRSGRRGLLKWASSPRVSRSLWFSILAKKLQSFTVILETERRQNVVHILKRNQCCEFVITSDAHLSHLRKLYICYPAQKQRWEMMNF